MKSKFLISILVAVLLTTSYGYARQDPNKSVGVIAKSGPLQGVTAYTDTYALFVGISDYANKDIPSIPSAENDAKTMRDTLVTKFGFNPDPSHTVVLTGSRATKTNIEAELARLSNTNRVHKTDRVFVYFSCHGQRVPLPNGEAAGYLLPHGATVSLNDVTNPSEYQTSCLDMEDVVKRLSASPATHRALVIDACFSGYTLGSKGLGDGKTIMPEQLKKMLSQRGLSVLTAGTSEDEAKGSDSRTGLSPFTRSIKEVLDKADLGGGTFTLGELAADAKKRTLDLTGRSQNPQFGVRDGVGDMVLFPADAPRSDPPRTNLKRFDYANLEFNATIKDHYSWVTGVAFSPNGKTFATACEDTKVRVFDAVTHKMLQKLSHGSYVGSVAFSPNGKTIVSAGIDKTVKFWNVADGVLLKTVEDLNATSVKFSPDGTILAVGCVDSTVKLLNAKSGRLLKTLKGHTESVQTIAFSPDGSLLVSGGNDSTVKLWNVVSGNLVKSFVGHERDVHTVAISPNGITIASGAGDDTVKLWDVASGFLKQTISNGHSNSVFSIAFSPDGVILATGGGDGAKIWDAESGILLRTLEGHSDAVDSLAFSPDGLTLATASLDMTVRLWKVKQ